MISVIDRLAAALPCPLDANRTEICEGEVVVYDFNTTNYDGALRLVTLKLYIYAPTMARGLELEDMCDRALVTLGDSPLTASATSCERNGGGWLTEGDSHCRIAYYQIVLRDIITR